MTNNEILQDIISKLTPRMIIQGASRDNEKPMGYLLTYIRDMYGLPKTQGWDIAEAVLKHYNIENKEYHSIFENKTMKQQKAIKMNESQLRDMIKEAIANMNQIPSDVASFLRSRYHAPEDRLRYINQVVDRKYSREALQPYIDAIQQEIQQRDKTPEQRRAEIEAQKRRWGRETQQYFMQNWKNGTWGHSVPRTNTVSMNESQLQRVISENIAKVLNEDFSCGRNVWDLIDELKQTMSADDILARLISRIGEYAAIKYLEDIKNVEAPAQDEPGEF